MTRSHIDAHRDRQRKIVLKRRVVSGMTLATVIMIVGAYRYLFVPYANDHAWIRATIGGAVLFCLSLVLPDSLFWLEGALHVIGGTVGRILFTLVLVPCYALLVLVSGPVRRRQGRDFLSWQDASPHVTSSWTPKVVTADVSPRGGRKRSLTIMPLRVMGYFARQRLYVFMPLLLVMIIAGLLLFFMQTSALAPFIYTLF